MPPTKAKATAKKTKAKTPKSTAASSTRKENQSGSHVTTIVQSNSATAEEPVSVQTTPTTPEEWLSVGRQCWNSTNDVENERRIVVEYSSYKTEFPCRGAHGCMRWCDIDAEYALSFVFEGDFKVSIRKFPEGTNSSSDEALTPVVPMAIGKEGMNEENTRDRSIDEIYFFIGNLEETESARFVVEVEEDLNESNNEKNSGGINFASSSEEVSWRGGDGGGRKKEGCSCIYGNPCMDQYVCNDWANRFEVAKKNGFKG